MALKKIRLGDYIEQCDEKNTDGLFSLDYVKGISTQKKFIETKANMDDVSLNGYKIVKPGCFSYVPDTSRRGNKISLAFNDSNKVILVSSISVVFKVINEKELLSEYLFMYFNRPEFDRYSRYNSFGSAREPFNWEDMCDIEIELPDLATQEKFVKVYLSMLENQKQYERGYDDFKLVCDGYIEELRRKLPSEKIGKYLTLLNNKNSDNLFSYVLGISKEGFITPKQDPGDLKKYYIFNYNNFVYSPPRINIGSIGLYQECKTALASPIYVVFKVNNENSLLPEYLNLWLHRTEFFRSTEYYSMASVRNNFSFDLMEDVKIPIPSIEIQKSIVEIFNTLNIRKQINEKLKQQIKDICPILIKGAIEEAKEG